MQSAASLLLTMEGVAHGAPGVVRVPGENFDRRIVLGMLSIVAGAVVLNWQPDATVQAT